MDHQSFSTDPSKNQAAPYIGLAFEITVETNDIDVLSEATTTDPSISSNDFSGIRPSEQYIPVEGFSSTDIALDFPSTIQFEGHTDVPDEFVTEEPGDTGDVDADAGSYSENGAPEPSKGMVIGVTANINPSLINNVKGLSRQASKHRLSRKRKQTVTGATTTATTRKRVATKPRGKTCQYCKEKKKYCGWQTSTVYEPCYRATRAKVMGQTSEWFQASLSEIILYQLQTPSAVALDTQPIAQLKHNPEASHRLEMNFPVQFLGQATGLDMSPDQIELAQSPLVPVRIETSSNSKLSRAMLLRCFEYAYKHKNSSTAVALQLWAMCHATDPMRSMLQPIADQPHEELCKTVATAVLDPLRLKILAKLECFLCNSDVDKWTDCFQVCFLLLDLIDYTSSYTCYTMDQLHPEEITAFRKKLCHSSQIILGRYHHCVKKYAHRLLNWFDGADGFPMTNTSEGRLVRGVKKYIDFNDGDYRLRGTDAPPDDDHNFWTRQLFFTNWAAPYRI